MMDMEKQQLRSRLGKSPPLTESQMDWFERATNAMLTDETVEDPPEALGAEVVESTTLTPATEHNKPEVEAVEAVTEQPVDDMSPDEIREQVKELHTAMMELAEEQGLATDIHNAMREYGEDLYLAQQRGKVYAFRPMYWEEMTELENKSELEADKWLAERCVVVGLTNLTKPRARAGLYSNLARKILSVSDHQGDLNDMIIPTQY